MASIVYVQKIGHWINIKHKRKNKKWSHRKDVPLQQSSKWHVASLISYFTKNTVIKAENFQVTKPLLGVRWYKAQKWRKYQSFLMTPD